MIQLSQPTWNICQLGAVFFFNFFSFFTLSAISQTIVENNAKEYGINEHAGYYSGFLIYLVFTFGHFVATPIVEIITPKWSIVIGLVGYAMYELAFIILNEYYLYIASAFAGFSGSLLWTGQFDYLAQNTLPHTVDRSSSTLWGLSQISLVFGGMYLLVVYRFQSGNEFDMPLVKIVIGSFLVCTIVSIIIGVFLPKPAFKAEKYDISYLKHLSEIVKISFDRNLLLLFFTFCYTGMELAFFSAVYPTIISFTKELGNTRDLNAVCSICVGVGNVSGCFALSILGPKVREFGRKKMVLIAAIIHLTCFIMIVLTFPNESPLRPTTQPSIYPPNIYIIVISGFLLGVGDTIFNQQCYTMLSDIYERDKRIEAFAVYRFYQSAASCVVLFYSATASLHFHTISLVLFCILATITFMGIRVPEKMALRQESREELQIEKGDNKVEMFKMDIAAAISQTIIEKTSKTYGINEHAGYYSGFVQNFVFTFGHFVATPIVEIITPKWSIVIGLVGYAMYELAFIILNEYYLYIASAFAGFSGSLLWTGQFDFLAQNTLPHTIDRCSSALWGFSQISQVLGGIYLLFVYQFKNGNEFDMPLIKIVIGSFLFFSFISIIVGSFLSKPAYQAEKYDIPYFKHLSEIVKISFDRNLLLLFFTFCYTGIEMSFYYAVFPTMISFTKELGNTRDLNAVCSICVGVGTVSGSLTLSILGAKVREFGRKKMVLIAAIIHLTCFIMIVLTFPNESPLRPTTQPSIYPPNIYIIVISGFLLGVGDTIFNQQCYTMLSDIYERDKRIEAFAVYRFYQSAASCFVLFYSATASLHFHTISLVLFCILATITFMGIRVPEKMALRQESREELQIEKRDIEDGSK